MSTIDTRNQRKISAQIQRVLIVETAVAPSRLLGELLRSMGSQDIITAFNQEAAVELCALKNPQMIFTEYSGVGLDGLAFVRALRRSTWACRQAPVILVTSEATALTITAARDAGVHEFLRKPFTLGDLTKRLEAVTLRSRAWIEAIDYIGPDRRRFNSAEFSGVRKRRSDGHAGDSAERAKQAFQILAAAIRAIDHDPMQAMRSMKAQVKELLALAVETDNQALGYAALQVDQALKASVRDGHISIPHFKACAAALNQFMPAADQASQSRGASRLS